MRRVVCTIARGREQHLKAMMAGLAAQSLQPDCLVIAVMQETPFSDLPLMPFPVYQILVPGRAAPLAAARNACAARAKQERAELLVFLDVDCIPAPDLMAAFETSVAAGRCVMGNTRYLAERDEPGSSSFDVLWSLAAEHPARRFCPSKGARTVRFADMGEFWSLSFAMLAVDFDKTGGFDDRFTGYGAEDTDFACSMEEAGLELHWDPAARAVHQWHSVHIPPLGHLEDIVRNGNLFYAKHGRWCMEYWIKQLVQANYVEWDEAGGVLRITRHPSCHELQAAAQGGDVRFS